MRASKNQRSTGRYWIMAGMAGVALTASTFMSPAPAGSEPETGRSWISSGRMNVGRTRHSASLLPNGKVLVAGGVQGDTAISSAELFDPATGTWTRTGDMDAARFNHTSTLLPNGKVLIAAGNISTPPPYPTRVTNTAELYDPTTGTWSATGDMIRGRATPTATLLTNGQVLVVGGITGAGVGIGLRDAEIYNPLTGAWSPTGNLSIGRFHHTATLLANGQVLVTGGESLADHDLMAAEVFDPLSATWALTTNLNEGRSSHTATRLASGHVVAIGGYDGWEYDGVIDYVRRTHMTAVQYHILDRTWTKAGKTWNPHGDHTATLLPDGKILVVSLVGSELYDPGTGLSTLPQGGQPRGHTATLLQNGQVLLAGGYPQEASTQLVGNLQGQTGGVVSLSAASYSPMGLASEAIAAAFGDNLAVATISTDSLTLPTALAGTTVTIIDSTGTERSAPLLFVSPGQVNYVVPSGTVNGNATVKITNAHGTTSSGVALIYATAPGLFAANSDGRGVAAAQLLRVRIDGSQTYENVAQFDSVQNQFVGRPIDLGPQGDQVFLVLFGTGLRFRPSLAEVIATVGGAPVSVEFAGAQGTFAGLDQINIRLSRDLGHGELDVLLMVGAELANPVRINLK